jgi:hypothetical protein
MADNALSFDELIQAGWHVVAGRGTSSPRFTSISFCLDHDHHTVICVQGYGATMDAALADATHEANKWLARQSSPRRL